MSRTALRPDETLHLPPALEAGPHDAREAVAYIRLIVDRCTTDPAFERFLEEIAYQLEELETAADMALDAYEESDPDAIDTGISAQRREHGTWSQ